MSTLTRTVQLVTTRCPNCDITYAVPDQWLEGKRTSGNEFFCPNGHSLSYRETEAQRLQKQVEQLKASRQSWQDQAEAAERSNAALRGVVTRTKRRAQNGVCPAGCRRHFADLGRHMASKHPGFADEAGQ